MKLRTLPISSLLGLGFLLLATDFASAQGAPFGGSVRSFGRTQLFEPPLWFYLAMQTNTKPPPLFTPVFPPTLFKFPLPPNEMPVPYFGPFRPPNVPATPPPRAGSTWPMRPMPMWNYPPAALVQQAQAAAALGGFGYGGALGGDVYGSLQRVRDLFADLGGLVSEAANPLPGGQVDK